MGKTYPNKRDYTLQKRQHQHEERMKVLEIMARDPEMKYFLGVAMGAATGAIGLVLSQTMGATVSKDEQTAREALISKSKPTAWEWLFNAPVAIGKTAGGWAAGAATGEEDFYPDFSMGGNGLFGFVPGVLAMGGGGFAGFCAMVLILKSIFGDEDVASLMGATAQAVDAAVPF